MCAFVANIMAGGVVYLMAKYAGLVVNDQSQYILSILVIGAGTDYALLLVARYREELRRHDDRHEAMAFALHRAAPAIIASAATVVVGLHVPVVRRPQLDRQPRAGPRRRRGRDPAGDGHPAARPPGDPRPVDLLAGAARRSARPSPPRRASGPGSATGSRSARARSGSAPPCCWRSPAWACSSSTPTACPPRTASPRRSTRSRPRSCSPTTTWPTTPTRSRWSTNDDELAEVGEAVADIDGLGTPTDPTSIGDGRSYFEVPIKYDLASQAAFDIVELGTRQGPRRRRRRCAGRRRGGVLPRHQDGVPARQQGGHPAGADRGAA